MPVRRFVLLFAAVSGLASCQKLTNPALLPLEGETFHVQGIEIGAARLWVTAVDSRAHKGYLFEYSLPAGKRLRAVEIQDGPRYHPGGMAGDETSLWIPVAEYRRNSTAVIQRRDKTTLEVTSQFQVPDHIGCVAVEGDTVVGGNWDSRELYVWNRRGELQRKLANPSSAAYQDMKFNAGRLVASGLLPGRAGVVDWLDFPSLVLNRRLPLGKTDRGDSYAREGMAIQKGRLYFLPEDGPSRLFSFELE